MSSELFEKKLRWPNAPLICIATNRMAFENEKEIKAYLTKYCPHYDIEFLWKCDWCNLYHHECGVKAPSQDGWRPRRTPFVIPRKTKINA